MASKFRAIEAGGLPYATIPSHYFYQKLFQTRLQRALFDFRAALIYIIRLLASISRPVVYYASNARLGAGATRFFSTIVRRGVLRTFGDNHLTLT